MCTSWVKGATREYSLTNHTGPPVLWSPIRLAHCLNYSQSKTIKSNYDQLWTIRMPRRLIAQRDGAASCHFQEAVTLIVPPQSLDLCPSMNAGWFQRMPVASTDFGDKRVNGEKKKKKINAETASPFCLLVRSLLHHFQITEVPTGKWKHWGSQMNDRLSAVCSCCCQLKTFFLAAWPVWLSAIYHKTICSWQLGILVMWFASWRKADMLFFPIPDHFRNNDLNKYQMLFPCIFWGFPIWRVFSQ